MPDIFLSYNREDQATARRFAEAFQAEGLEVWWDTTLRAGEAYDRVTEQALGDAKAVVVLWSPRSVDSRWVRSEATQADRNGTMVPVTIEPCKRPIMFELTQTAELSHWDGDARDKAWQAFLADLKRFVEAGAAIPKSAPAPPSAAPAQVSTAAPSRLSICVLPFANMSRDEDQEYFADGISEDIITDLSKVSALFVIARNTAFTFKGRSVEVPQVASQLKVTHVLEGSVRKAGQRVRITAQLIDGTSGGHVWAERWDRDLDDIFALQDEISEAIVGALKLKLLPAERSAIDERGTSSLQAYDRFLRARALYYSADALPEMHRALELYSEALAIDPDFILPRIGMCLILTQIRIFAPGSYDLNRFDALVDESLARAPDHWGTQIIVGAGLMRQRRWDTSLPALQKAAAKAPASVVEVQLYLAYALGALGRIEEGVGVWEAARSVDPLSVLVTSALAQWYLIAGRTEDSRAEYERTLDLAGAREILEQTALFRIWDLADVETTRAQFRRALDTKITPLPFLTKAMELLDRPKEALEVLRQAFGDSASQDGTRMAHVGWYAALFGDADLAIQALRRAILDTGLMATFVIWYPLLRRARQTLAFKQLVRDLGVYDYWRASGNWGDFARPVGDDDFEIIR